MSDSVFTRDDFLRALERVSRVEERLKPSYPKLKISGEKAKRVKFAAIFRKHGLRRHVNGSF